MKKVTYTFLLSLLPITAILFLLISFCHPEQELLTSRDTLNLTTYTDSEDPKQTGNSQIISFIDTPTIQLTALIKNKISYPYAGFRFIPVDSQPFIDLSPYNRIEITLDSTNATFFILDLATYVDGYSQFNDFFSFRHHTQEIFTKSGPQQLSIPLRKIATQNWWYELRKLDPHRVGKPDYTRCRAISFEINAVKPTPEPLSMSVSSIKLVRNTTDLKVISAGLFCLWILLLRLTKSKKNVPSISKVAKGIPVVLESAKQIECDRITSVISQRYMEPDLALLTVARESGVSAEKVSSLLIEFSDLPFKQYLNTVRITESKRLLIETSRQISEIAHAVGYSYPSTFNRVFKDEIGISPTDYRRSNSENEPTVTS